jgi:hypothetical protein
MSLMRKKQYITISCLSILLASVFFMDNSQAGNNNLTDRVPISAPFISQSNQTFSFPSVMGSQISTESYPSINNTIGGRAAIVNPTPELTSSNLTAILGSVTSPKALLASAIDQIRNSTAKMVGGDNQTAVNIFVRNPETMLLSHQIIPPKDFILVYDAIGYKIGQLSELKPAQLQLISGLSKPGYTCTYYAELVSTKNNDPVITNTNSNEAVTSGVGNLTVTNIELLNPTNYRVTLPDTATLTISVNQIIPLLEPHLHYSK